MALTRLMAAFWLAFSAAPRGDVTVQLSDGTRFYSMWPEDEVTVVDGKGDRHAVAAGKIRLIGRAGERAWRVVTDGEAIEGTIEPDAFEWETAFGRMKVKMSDVASIEAGRHATGIVDEATVAAWTFDRVEGDRAIDHVKGRPLVMHDMEITTDETGVPAMTKKSRASYAVVASDEALKFEKGDFTIEARFKVGAPFAEWAQVLDKPDFKTSRRNYCLYVNPTGYVHWNVGPPGESNSPAGAVALDAWAYVAVVVRPEARRLTMYVNGARVLEAERDLTMYPNDDAIFIGAGPETQNGGHQSAGKIQFVRLSRGARTAEEIAAMQAAFVDRKFQTGPKIEGGAVLRRGEALAGGVAGVKLRTPEGVVDLPAKGRGVLTLYPKREKELGVVRERAKLLVEELGSDDFERREAAQLELTQIGAPAVEAVKAASSSADPEVSLRAGLVMDALKASGRATEFVGDVFESDGKVFRGWAEFDAIDVETKHGTIRLDAADVRTLIFKPR